MKSILTAFISVSLFTVPANSSAQTGSSAEKSAKLDKEQHISIDQFPKGMVINHLNGWGGMTIAINELPAGTDLSPLLEGLKNNSCQVPHWGSILKGTIKLKYDDGKEVILKAGDVFYMAPGHTASAIEDVKLVDFSPEEQMKDVIKHIEKKVTGSKQQ